jgi:hypothetical protein
MHEIAALLATLTHIAAEPCSCNDERSLRAVALVKTYSTALYERVGILQSNRPTSSAKLIADQTLAELRRQILAVEARSGEPSRAAYTAARNRIEMARRVLAARLVADAAPPIVSLDRTPARYQPHALKAATQVDWQILEALRPSFAGREQVARNRAAIADSQRLLAACG